MIAFDLLAAQDAPLLAARVAARGADQPHTTRPRGQPYGQPVINPVIDLTTNDPTDPLEGDALSGSGRSDMQGEESKQGRHDAGAVGAAGAAGAAGAVGAAGAGSMGGHRYNDPMEPMEPMESMEPALQLQVAISHLFMAGRCV